MIINYDSPGQLSNRIWSLVPSIAYGLEHGEKVLLINFDEYAFPFENLNKNPLIRFASRKLFKRFFVSLKARGKLYNGRSNIFSKLFGIKLIEGWSNRLGNQEMVVKQSDEIRKIFTFKSDITDSVDAVFDSLNKEGIVVGVHIRRGDYDTWLDGIYYYKDEEYLLVMKNIEEQLSLQGKKAIFLLCSNERLDFHHFESLNCLTIPNTSGEKDLYGLSKCSYIVGPPSSYSQWASFLGKKPLKLMLTKDEEFRLSDFSGITSFNRFENETELNID